MIFFPDTCKIIHFINISRTLTFPYVFGSMFFLMTKQSICEDINSMYKCASTPAIMTISPITIRFHILEHNFEHIK